MSKQTKPIDPPTTPAYDAQLQDAFARDVELHLPHETTQAPQMPPAPAPQVTEDQQTTRVNAEKNAAQTISKVRVKRAAKATKKRAPKHTAKHKRHH